MQGLEVKPRYACLRHLAAAKLVSFLTDPQGARTTSVKFSGNYQGCCFKQLFLFWAKAKGIRLLYAPAQPAALYKTYEGE